MCRKCQTILKGVLEERDEFTLSNRRTVPIDHVDGDDIYLGTDPSNPTLHVSHVAEVLHWLRDEHFVCGVSSGTTAVKTLLSGKGKLDVSCTRCANNASEAWALLVAAPGVRRDGQSGLAPDVSTM